MLVTVKAAGSREGILGVPPGAFVIRNSGRSRRACGRKWYLSEAEGLSPVVEAGALSYGTAWHQVQEDVHRVWMRAAGTEYLREDLTDCAWCGRLGLQDRWTCVYCSGTGAGPVPRAVDGLRARSGRSEREARKAEQRAETLYRAADGWLRYWGGTPPDGMRVVAVELGIGMPIGTYAPDVLVVEEEDGPRLARPGEARAARTRKAPAYVQSRIDVVYADGSALWVYEQKSSATPEKYLRGLSVDPQVTTYEAVLQHAVDRGLLQFPSPDCVGGIAPGTRVAGWIYDVSSSRLQRDPTILKGRAKKDGTRVGGGGISTAANNLASVPSWRLRDLADATGPDEDGNVLGLAPEDLAALIDEQEATVDARFYVRESGVSGAERLEEVRRELRGEAAAWASLHRAAARVDGPGDVAEHFPRVPICRQGGGSCPYTAPCYRDGPEAREWFTVRGRAQHEDEHDDDDHDWEDEAW